MASHHLGSPTNLPPLPLHSCRIDQHIYLPGLLGLYLLGLEEAVDRETTAKPLVHPIVVER